MEEKKGGTLGVPQKAVGAGKDQALKDAVTEHLAKDKLQEETVKKAAVGHKVEDEVKVAVAKDVVDARTINAAQFAVFEKGIRAVVEPLPSPKQAEFDRLFALARTVAAL